MPIPSSSNSDSNIGEDDVVKPCPLCKAAVRFFFINFNEKVLLCENVYCEFPFGYEDFQFLPLDSEVSLDMGASSLARRNICSSSSVTSTLAWSDIEKLNMLCEPKENQGLNLDVALKNSKKKIKQEEHINNKEINKNVQDLKYLTMELNEMDQDTDDSECIKNEKWLKKLMKLQGLSGVKLVKKEEMRLLKQKSPAFRGGELKIDIDSNRSNMSSINIQIMNTDGD